MRYIHALILACALLCSLPALASERPDHYKGEPSKTLEQAFANMGEYNAKLAAMLDKPVLSPVEMHEVHQITYSLENALEMINGEYGHVAELLEEVHVASEKADPDTVKRSGSDYLQRLQKLLP